MMGLGLAQLERITADIQANDLEWVEVAEDLTSRHSQFRAY